MTSETLYHCDFCGEEITRIRSRGFGLEPDNMGAFKPTNDFESAPKHICAMCVASIRLLGPVCGEGFAHEGGPHCDSDHK